MKYYPETIKYFEKIIKERTGWERNAIWTIKRMDDTAHPCHLLWMLDQMESMENITKRARWIGHINGVLVADLGMDNKESRKTIKNDIEKGYE
jgi:hypothetical protein